MTNREKELFELIQLNPMMSQNEIAEKLKITRTSVAVHISNLVKKGYILGKGYILETGQPITIIGGANMDLQGQTYHSLIMADSNPGIIRTSLGGVGRNIAENAALLGLPVRLITAVGQDIYGNQIKENARNRGIDISDSLTSTLDRTSIYMYFTDASGDMVVAVNDMAITNQMDEVFLENKIKKIDFGAYTVIDANISQQAIEFLANQLNHTKLILDPVSTVKGMRAKNVLGKFYAIKPNLIEAEALLDIQIKGKEDIVRAGQLFLEMGIQLVIISLGKDGVYYADGNSSFFKAPMIKKPINTTGAGDAFIAGLLYGLTHHYEKEDLVNVCLAAAGLTSLSSDTISKDLNEDTLLRFIKEDLS